jgi:hypothetical protein
MEIKFLGMTFRLEIILLAILLIYIMNAHTICSCSKVGLSEGFQMIKDAGSALNYKMDEGVPLNKTPGALFMNKDFQSTTIPLPDGKMDFFENTQFKPECCPGIFSNGSGCACLSKDQMNHLFQRGGNNTTSSSV